MSTEVNERVLLPSALTPSHYALALTPDLDKLTFQGAVSITVAVSTEQVSEVTLHSKEIQVSKVTFSSSVPDAVSPSLVGINYNLKLTTVTFVFDGPFPVGQGVLAIEYTGILNGDMAGFYKSTYVDADGNKKVMASTQFEALDARRYFFLIILSIKWFLL